MKYRAESPTGDYVFGPGSRMLTDSPEAVAQAVLTRLRLYTGEWFLDSREGLDLSAVLGYGTQMTRDREVKARIAGTPGVLDILSYEGRVEGRAFRVDAEIDTVYGRASINGTL